MSTAQELAGRLCRYCRPPYTELPNKREARPYTNAKGVFVHLTYSTRGLGSEHRCDAVAIWAMREEKRRERAALAGAEGEG